MPVITVEGPTLTKEQKRELIENLSEIASKIMNINKESYVVYIKENDLDNVGVGGAVLSDRIKK